MKRKSRWEWTGDEIAGLDERERDLYFMDYSCGKCKKLINSISVVETIYFVSVEQKKELFTEITRCASDHEK